MARTLVQWREAILAWHTTGYTNGPVEDLNSLIKMELPGSGGHGVVTVQAALVAA